MSLIAPSVLLGIADRAAWQTGKIVTAYQGYIPFPITPIPSSTPDINPVGGGLYFTRVTDTDDPDVEIPLIAPYEGVDTTVTNLYFVLKYSSLCTIVTAMDIHFNNMLSVGSWDGYLSTNDIRVSQYFNQLYRAAKGSFMLAVNVFSESADKFATAEVIAGPVLTFTDGLNYGNGSIYNIANGTYYAATQLRVITATTIGASNLDLRLTVKDINNNLTTIDVTVPSGTPQYTAIDIGSSTDRFLDVTNIIFKPAGATGTVGDQVWVYNLPERVIAP